MRTACYFCQRNVKEIDFDQRYCHGFKGVTTTAWSVLDDFSKSIIAPINMNPSPVGSVKINVISTGV